MNKVKVDPKFQVLIENMSSRNDTEQVILDILKKTNNLV